MPNLFIMTTGKSLLENLEKQNNNTQAQKAARQLSGKLPNNLSQLYERPDTYWTKDTQTIIKYYASRYNTLSLGETATAEIASLFYLAQSTQSPRLQSEDEVIFLTSDTNTGVFCALVNAYLLAGGDSDRICIWEDSPLLCSRKIAWDLPVSPNDALQKLVTSQIDIIPIPNLDPTRPQQFSLNPNSPTETGLYKLGIVLAKLIHRAEENGQRPVINFTGGMKAIVPLLAQIATFLGSTKRISNMGGIPLVCLHEQGDAIMTIPTFAVTIDPDWAAAVRNDYGNMTDINQLSPKIQPLFHNEAHKITLSPLGLVLLAILHAQEKH